ncbi:MAG: transposase [Thermoguttaceae bacterium]|nr:transposase [Thermoguttaceae bacterium]
MTVAISTTPLRSFISRGNLHDGSQGLKLIESLGKSYKGSHLLVDKAYEGDQTRKTAVEHLLFPVVPPKANRRKPWDYDKELYKRRRDVECFFARIKRFRHVFTR